MVESFEEYTQTITDYAIENIELDFNSLLDFFAEKRADYQLRTGNIGSFGEKREDNEHVFFSVMYDHEIDIFADIVDTNSVYDLPKNSVFKHFIKNNFDCIIANSDRGKILHSVNIENEEIVLVEAIIATKKVPKSSWIELWSLVDEDMKNKADYQSIRSGIFVHMLSRYLPQILDICKNIFNKIFSSDNPINEIAELHWWMALSIFYKRGNAAISEYMAIYLLKHHNIEFNKWVHQVDIYAFMVGLEVFKNNYINLFN